VEICCRPSACRRFLHTSGATPNRGNDAEPKWRGPRVGILNEVVGVLEIGQSNFVEIRSPVIGHKSPTDWVATVDDPLALFVVTPVDSAIGSLVHEWHRRELLWSTPVNASQR
jgi:hypothetical protein